MNLSLYEQETIINYNEEEKTACVYTHNKALRNRLEKLSRERPEECRIERISRSGQAVDFLVPKSWVSVRPPKKMNYTEEQRREIAERMSNLQSVRRRQKQSS